MIPHQPYGPSPLTHNNEFGGGALALGVLSLPLWLLMAFGGNLPFVVPTLSLFGVLAIVLGRLGIKAAGRGTASNRGTSYAGYILGVISCTVAASLLVVGMIIGFIAGVSSR